MTESSVIFVDDDPHIRQAIAQTLSLEDLPVSCFEGAPSALQHINAEYDGVVLCDYNMPDMNGLEMLDWIRAIDDTIPVIILTGQGDISTAVTAMQQGAYDFIEKPFDHDELIELLRHALEKRHLALENRRLKAQLRHLARPGPRMLGDSPSMRKVMATIDPILDISANILLHGETGSGKDALARYIHENSGRSAHNFVAINCGAVPENLIESELFGHEAGAFTGVEPVGFDIVQAETGAFADEVGDIGDPLVHQPHQPGGVAVDRRAQHDGVADVLVAAQGGVEQREHAPQAPAMQRQLLLPAVLPHPVQVRRQQLRHVGMQVVVAVLPRGHAPVDQVHLKPLGPQETHQTALGKQIVDQHVHRQGRHDHDGRLVGRALHIDHLAVQLDKVLRQRRVVTQAYQPIGVQGLERCLPCLHQAGGPEYAVEGVTGV